MRIGLAGAFASICLASAALSPRPFFIWNVSASAPLGLYRVEASGPIRRGDMVVARLLPGAALLAARRHYLPLGVPLVKRIAAVPGDVVCAHGSKVLINGRRSALRLYADARGRKLPWPFVCGALQSHEYFLLGDHRASFDSRYFGAVASRQIVGRAVLLWRR